MGIRFACHHCNNALHVKDFQAGKKGRCPECKGAFRIPQSDASYSLAIESDASIDSNSTEILNVPALHISEKSMSQNGIPNSSAVTSMPGTAVATISTGSGLEPLLPPGPGLASMPPALANAINAAWFVRPPSGGQFGPASSSLLMEWIHEKRITPDSLVWRDGLAQWQAVSAIVPELFVPPKSSDVSAAFSTSPLSNPSTSSLANPASSASDLAKQRREKKRRQQISVIIALSVISLILLSVLIFVLLFPLTLTTNPPTNPTP